MIEGDQLGHVEQLGRGKERVGTEPLREVLGPHGGRPPMVTDEPAAEGRKRIYALAFDRCERVAKCFQRLLRQTRKPGERV